MGVLDQCPKIEEEIPLVKSYLAQFAARAIIVDLVSITDLAHPLENGAHFPLFLLCLQQMVKLKDREWLGDLFQQSKVNMLKMLPGMCKPTLTICSFLSVSLLLVLMGIYFYFFFPSSHRMRSEQRQNAGDSRGERSQLFVPTHETGEGAAEADQSRSLPTVHLQVDQRQHLP